MSYMNIILSLVLSPGYNLGFAGNLKQIWIHKLKKSQIFQKCFQEHLASIEEKKVKLTSTSHYTQKSIPGGW